MLYCIFAAMAGNIIPAIATTNAIIAALIVMEGIKVLHGDIDKCKQVGKNDRARTKRQVVGCTCKVRSGRLKTVVVKSDQAGCMLKL